MADLLQFIGPGGVGNRKCIMMDNLNVHHDPLVLQMITNAGHSYAFRAPYWPKDGPIEYFFNALECGLRRETHSIRSVVDLEDEIVRYVNATNSFAPFFEHVGFR
jgi:transposase